MWNCTRILSHSPPESASPPDCWPCALFCYISFCNLVITHLRNSARSTLSTTTTTTKKRETNILDMLLAAQSNLRGYATSESKTLKQKRVNSSTVHSLLMRTSETTDKRWMNKRTATPKRYENCIAVLEWFAFNGVFCFMAFDGALSVSVCAQLCSCWCACICVEHVNLFILV